MIGVFDSGIGGLTVLTEIHKKIPQAPLLYVADHAYAPYGDKSKASLLSRCRSIIQWFQEQNCQLIVIACNTATAIAIDELRAEFALPIVGVEPGIKPAALNSKSRAIGILATENTVASARYRDLLANFIPNVKVVSQGCNGLADAIEQNNLELPALIQKYCQPLIDEDVDHVVLGCTHYPLVKRDIQMLMPVSVTVIDTSSAVANEVKRQYRSVDDSAAEHSIKMVSTGELAALNNLFQTYADLNWLHGIPWQTQIIDF